MLKKLARQILESEIREWEKELSEYSLLFSEVERLRKENQELQDTLDKKSIPLDSGIVLEKVEDLNFTQEENNLFNEIGANPLFQQMTEKMSMRALYALGMDPAPLTKDKVIANTNFRAGLVAIKNAVINETSKRQAEQVNSLTGEVHTPKKR